jgi:hypothetical protein
LGDHAVRRAALPVLITLLCACGPAGPIPVASIPAAPVAPAGWETLASFGGSGPGFSGIGVDVAGRPLAFNVTCAGLGTLVVTYGAGDDPRAAAREAFVFPCSSATTTTTRRELPATVASGALNVDGAIFEDAGAFAQPAFQVAVEQAAD